MIKLKSIKITGFKEKDRIVDLKFSDESATVIYGENGSGKTTLLRIIHAVFTKNSQYLLEQNVRGIELVFFKKIEKTFYIKSKKDNSTGDVHYEWDENFEDLMESDSILFGVDRGKSENLSNDDIEKVQAIVGTSQYALKNPIKALEFNQYLDNLNGKPDNWEQKRHIKIDAISIENIENIIISEYRKGLRIRNEKIQNAFFNTISNAVDIEMEEKVYELPDNFEARIEAKKEVLITLVADLDESSLQKKLLNYLQPEKTGSEIQESKIFRALLINILEKAEDEDIELKAVNTLIKFFNGHLHNNKKLIVSEEDAYIQFVNGQLGPKHSLEKLSSGERHLLTFLTLFLIFGRGRDFFMVDEPEISLHLRWQRKLISVLTELSPNSQIIAASHSPSIANRNSNYLVELA